MHIDIIVKKTGYFYGFKHGGCKKRKNQLTVLCHNGAKFDFRLIITYLAEKCFDSNTSCISNSMETFLTFSISNFDNTIINLRFVDPYKHLSSPLDGIIKSLLNKDSDINLIKNKFPSLFQYFADKALKLLRKGVYPYDYVDKDWENKLEEKELPNIEYFHSSLSNTNTKCSIDDHNYAKEVYMLFGCKKIKDYNDLYVKTDVLLLADAFASYRKNSYSSYRLDPLYCISYPGYSNRGMLKMTNIEIKLITDSNIYLITEKGMRGVRCEPIYYHAKANNEYVNPNFDKNKDEETYIVSLDTNSLYSTAICYKLPYGRPKFDNNISMYTIDYILKLDPHGEYCHAFVVDIHYPYKLHDRDDEFPILCDKLIPPGDKTKKLMSTFYDKKKLYYISSHAKLLCRKTIKIKKNTLCNIC